jgi:hypothetical protein
VAVIVDAAPASGNTPGSQELTYETAAELALLWGQDLVAEAKTHQHPWLARLTAASPEVAVFSYRVAMPRKPLSRWKQRSIVLRRR